MEGDCEVVQLGTFGHQVGGHSVILKLPNQTICKPLLPREHFFYESVAQELKNYTPEYYGVIRVCFQPTVDAKFTSVAYPKATIANPDPETKSMLSCSTKKSVHTEKDQEGIVFKSDDSSGNPWSVNCLNVMSSKLTEYVEQDYIVLEDLTARYHSPCILDLKVGTRQHGDDASEEKKIMHTKMCTDSTSSSLGVRLCGAQMFNAATSEYIFRDKYYGRQLDEARFHGALKDFLYDGSSYRTDILPELVDTLKQLREVIKSLSSYRLFSGSLMIIYDGQKTSSEVGGAPLPRDTTSPQDASMKGMPASWTTRGLWPNRSSRSPWHTRPELLKFRQKVDVRLIDFAHTTHAGFVHDPIRYEGPDEGYITGLTTLISAFENMFK
eukprot:Em0004g35a